MSCIHQEKVTQHYDLDHYNKTNGGVKMEHNEL